MITKDCKSILLADDTAFFRSKLSAILVEVGHKVRAVADGAEAITELKATADSTDLLILDLQMPEIDGYGVIEWMHSSELLKKVPVLIITGAYDNNEVLKKIAPFGITDVMTKAFTPEQVVNRVNRILFESKANIRKEERLPVSIPVDFMLEDVEDSMQTGFILNITPGGLFLHSRTTLEQGAVLKMKFSLPGVVTLIEAEGAVQWGSGSEETSGLFQGNGVVFTEVAESEKELIKEFVKKENEKNISPQEQAKG